MRGGVCDEEDAAPLPVKPLPTINTAYPGHHHRCRLPDAATQRRFSAMPGRRGRVLSVARACRSAVGASLVAARQGSLQPAEIRH